MKGRDPLLGLRFVRNVSFTVTPFAIAAFTLAFSAVVAPALAQGVSTGASVSDRPLHLNSACRVSKAYIRLLNDGEFPEMGALFADRVDYVGPDAVPRGSRDEVTKVYIHLGDSFKSGPPKIRITRLIPMQGNECFLEFEMFHPDTKQFKLTAIDHIKVDGEGRII